MKKTALASDQKHPQTANGGRRFHEFFSRFAHMAARATGSPAAFLIATTFLIVWAATGPVFGYSDTWQLVINTATTIITFLMVFLIQNTQNRDSMALQVKLAELIIAMKGAENRIAAARRSTLTKQAANGRAAGPCDVRRARNNMQPSTPRSLRRC
jgi:low affinity Fe/Cu permease